MTIEFRCSQCNQLLRVPETAAGKNARCPKCQSLMTVPGTSSEPQPPDSGAAPLPSAIAAASAAQAQGAWQPGTSGQTHAYSSGGGAGDFDPPPALPLAGHPFGEGGSPFGSGTAGPGSVNPYASPLHPTTAASQHFPIHPQQIAADAIFNYAWNVWKANLGLLIGITVVAGVASYLVAIPFSVLQMVFQQNGEKEAAIGVTVLGQILNNLVQMYLGIGQAQIALKLARRQVASFADLFGGMTAFLPVLGGFIIAWLVLPLALLLLIVPAILLVLAFWPFYYLLVDQRAGVIESFSIAGRITKGNWGSAFVLWLMSVGIVLLGCMALCVGVLFAAPLVSVMWATAYLMMSGQLMPYAASSQPVKYAPA
jgi:phage FluMu protein Com